MSLPVSISFSLSHSLFLFLSLVLALGEWVFLQHLKVPIGCCCIDFPVCSRLLRTARMAKLLRTMPELMLLIKGRGLGILSRIAAYSCFADMQALPWQPDRSFLLWLCWQSSFMCRSCTIVESLNVLQTGSRAAVFEGVRHHLYAAGKRHHAPQAIL